MSCYFNLFYCLLDLSCGECDVISLFLCASLLGDLFVLCVSCLTVCELFGETIRNMFGCGCYFVVECYGVFSAGGGALLDRPCRVFQRMCL